MEPWSFPLNSLFLYYLSLHSFRAGSYCSPFFYIIRDELDDLQHYFNFTTIILIRAFVTSSLPQNKRVGKKVQVLPFYSQEQLNQFEKNKQKNYRYFLNNMLKIHKVFSDSICDMTFKGKLIWYPNREICIKGLWRIVFQL